MKKLLAGGILVVLLGIIVFFLFRGTKDTNKPQKSIVCNAKAFIRVFPQKGNWNQWWPGTTTQKQGANYFSFNGVQYTIREQRMNSLLITLQKENDSVSSELFFLPASVDTVLLSWQLADQHHYQASLPDWIKKSIKNDWPEILSSAASFYTKEENLYGIAIKNDKVTDSALISTSLVSKTYPDNEMVYGMLKQLENYASTQGARPSGYPMLHIDTDDSTTFLVKVALPVDRILKDSGSIQYKWMMGGGNILTAEVKGGPHTINKYFNEINNYILDHSRTAPAIHFQSLITDRRKEPDSTKWLTRLNWPVM